MIVKVIANSLNLLLLEVILNNQCAFVLGRLITNHIHHTFEAVHSIKKRLRGRKGVMSMKLYTIRFMIELNGHLLKK